MDLHENEVDDLSGHCLSHAEGTHGRSRSYSIRSFEYFVEDDSEVPFGHAHRRSVSDNKDEIVVASQTTQSVHKPSLVVDVTGGRS